MAVTALVVALVPATTASAAPGVATFVPVSSIAVSDSTGEKPQSKVWQHAGAWWAVLPSTSSPRRHLAVEARAGRLLDPELRLSTATDTKPT